MMISVRVSWEVAKIMCEDYKNGSLAIINKKEIGAFLAQALSETNLLVEDLWIGAKKYGNDENSAFVWLHGNGVYNIGETHIGRGKENFEVDRNCLAFAREFHDHQQFIDLECNLKRPIICQKAYIPELSDTLTNNWITVGNVQYGTFYAKKTWKQAVKECHTKHFARLAFLSDYDVIELLGQYMLIGRPTLENAWIDGYAKDHEWRILYNNEILPEEMNSTTLYPPWPENKKTLVRVGCLLLDRHYTNYPIFQPARCERLRGYICARDIWNPTSNHSVLILDNIGYTIYYNDKSWIDAQAQCETHSAWLVEVTKDKIEHVVYVMAENKIEVSHVWIGGKLNEEKRLFTWMHSNTTIKKVKYIDLSVYPPWYETQYDENCACLNMDRENHDLPIFYGVSCDSLQPFICEQTDLSKLPEEKTI